MISNNDFEKVEEKRELRCSVAWFVNMDAELYRILQKYADNLGV